MIKNRLIKKILYSSYNTLLVLPFLSCPSFSALNAGLYVRPFNIGFLKSLVVGPSLSLLYTVSLRDIIYAHGLKYIHIQVNFKFLSLALKSHVNTIYICVCVCVCVCVGKGVCV